MVQLNDLLIRSSDDIRSAAKRMTDNRLGVLLVCDEDSHLAGVLSDGDVRRAVLAGTMLGSPLEKVMNTDPVTATSVEEATALLRQFTLVAVPVVNSEGGIEAAVIELSDRDLTVLRDESPAAQSGSGALAVIPARGGSKRIPRKNLLRIAGKSLLGWAIETAKRCRRVSQIIVSTDDREIADEARSHGITVPWLRPDELSGDDTPSLAVLLHALEHATEGSDAPPDYGLLLEPTAPLRTARHLEDALELLESSKADSVVSVSEVPHVLNPEELLISQNGLLRPYSDGRTMDTRRLRGRQTPAYVQNGLVYAFRISSVLRNRSLYGAKTVSLITGWNEFLDIDTPEDLIRADYRLEHRKEVM